MLHLCKISDVTVLIKVLSMSTPFSNEKSFDLLVKSSLKNQSKSNATALLR